MFKTNFFTDRRLKVINVLNDQSGLEYQIKITYVLILSSIAGYRRFALFL